jgi:NAD(P)-dependent dehydrogenase (short-subunit alcohol dehydrogenase family)
MSLTRAAIINMSSILGSMNYNDRGGYYPYRCSKVGII